MFVGQGKENEQEFYTIEKRVWLFRILIFFVGLVFEEQFEEEHYFFFPICIERFI